MAQMQINIRDHDRVYNLLTLLARRMNDLTPVMRSIGETIRDSVRRNFAEGRAPDGTRWRKSLRAERDGGQTLVDVRAERDGGQTLVDVRAERDGGQTLVDRAILRNSINVRAERDKVYVGTPVQYAPVHQFGVGRGEFGSKQVTVKSHRRRSRNGREYTVREHQRRALLPWGNIPPRPFLGVRTEDYSEIHDLLMDYLMNPE